MTAQGRLGSYRAGAKISILSAPVGRMLSHYQTPAGGSLHDVAVRQRWELQRGPVSDEGKHRSI